MSGLKAESGSMMMHQDSASFCSLAPLRIGRFLKLVRRWPVLHVHDQTSAQHDEATHENPLPSLANMAADATARLDTCQPRTDGRPNGAAFATELQHGFAGLPSNAYTYTQAPRAEPALVDYHNRGTFF